MWGKILEILARKVKEGVDVRMLYDGTCELSTLPHDYPKRLQKLGIKCKMFALIKPFVSTHYNYRDHRKILVIDGKVAFNGGINLADEYINTYEKYGHWKDTAVMVEGEAARSFTRMFLHMWFLDEKEKDFDSFLNVPVTLKTAKGFVHAKVFVCDDREAVVGTINLDYVQTSCGSRRKSNSCETLSDTLSQSSQNCCY